VLVKSCPDAFFQLGGCQSFAAPAPDVTEATTVEADSAVQPWGGAVNVPTPGDPGGGPAGIVAAQIRVTVHVAAANEHLGAQTGVLGRVVAGADVDLTARRHRTAAGDG
jgi:hypothetical protein